MERDQFDNRVGTYPGESATHARARTSAPSYADNELSAALAPAPSGVLPGEGVHDYLARVDKAQRPTDMASIPANLEAEDAIKKQASLALSRNGVKRNDPNSIFNAIASASAYTNPNQDAHVRDLITSEIAKSPAAQAKMDEERANREAVKQRGLPQATEQARNGFSPEGQIAFDQARDQERLRTLFPDQFKDLERDVERGNRTLATQNERKDADSRMKAMDLINERYENGLINANTAGNALLALTKMNRVQGYSSNNAYGAAVTSALGLQEGSPDSPGAVGQSGGVRFADEMDRATAITQADIAQRAKTKGQQIRNQKALDKDSGEPKIITMIGPDGREVQQIQTASGALKNLPGETKKKIDPGAFNTDGPDLLFVGPDGKSKNFSKEEYWIGSDNRIRARPTTVNADGYLQFLRPRPPEGVTDVTFGTPGSINMLKQTHRTRPPSPAGDQKAAQSDIQQIIQANPSFDEATAREYLAILGR